MTWSIQIGKIVKEQKTFGTKKCGELLVLNKI